MLEHFRHSARELVSGRFDYPRAHGGTPRARDQRRPARCRLSRAAGRGGGTDAAREARLEARSRRPGRARGPARRGRLVSGTNGKMTTTAMASAILSRPPAGLELLGREPGVRRHLDAPRPAGGRARSARGRRVRPPRGHAQDTATGRASATCSATSSTATASSSTSPSAGVTVSMRSTPTRPSSRTPTTRSVASLAEGRARRVLFGLDDPRRARETLQHASDSKYCVRCGRPYLRRRVRRSSGRLPVPRMRPHASCTRCSSSCEIEPDGLDGVGFTLATPSEEASVRLAVPGLYNVYNALAAVARTRARRRARRRRGRAPGLPSRVRPLRAVRGG